MRGDFPEIASTAFSRGTELSYLPVHHEDEAVLYSRRERWECLMSLSLRKTRGIGGKRCRPSRRRQQLIRVWRSLASRSVRTWRSRCHAAAYRHLDRRALDAGTGRLYDTMLGHGKEGMTFSLGAQPGLRVLNATVLKPRSWFRCVAQEGNRTLCVQTGPGVTVDGVGQSATPSCPSMVPGAAVTPRGMLHFSPVGVFLQKSHHFCACSGMVGEHWRRSARFGGSRPQRCHAQRQWV